MSDEIGKRFGEALVEVKKDVAEAIEDHRDELEDTDDLDEAIDGLFVNVLGDGLRDDIYEACNLSDDNDDDYDTVEEIWHHLQSYAHDQVKSMTAG